MERRDYSNKGLEKLIHITSLEDEQRASELVLWIDEYLTKNLVTDFDLEHDDLLKLSELFYRNLNFLKSYKEQTKEELTVLSNMRRYAQNS